MNPEISEVFEEKGVFHFRLSGVNVSLANALRRIILSEIPTYAFMTEMDETNQCHIEINTSRLHNEIIRQRLGCIPIHMIPPATESENKTDSFSETYQLEVDVKNDTDNIIYVTTEHFRLKNKKTGNYLTKEETQKIFPKDPITQMYIDFIRLRPKISDTIPGEQLKLTSDYSVSTARENGMYNVVSKCTYENTLDKEKVESVWTNVRNKLLDSDVTEEEIEFTKKNFYLLDAQRYFVENSFDFKIQSVGVYENEAIVKLGCMICSINSLILSKK